MKKYSKKEKLAVFTFSALVGLVVFSGSYYYFCEQLTDWQKSQKIDFSENSGSTKFKARLDSLSIGGLAFCASAITIMALKKFRKI